MRYKVTHTTTYDYAESVSVSHHLAHLSPRQCDGQRVEHHAWRIDPAPAVISEHVDYFGNTVTFFAVQGPHRRLTVTSHGTIDVASRMPMAASSPAWEIVRDRCADEHGMFDFVVDSPLVSTHARYADYAVASFPSGRPVLDALIDLTARIHRDFTFDPGTTDVATRLDDVFRRRAGVCQDFAHMAIACLRSLGLPTRYVSGYIETAPPPDTPRLTGADASHAWVSVHVAGDGWVDIDPTNNLVTPERHLTIGWGRDYSDVSPIRGVILGGGEHRSRVAVDVVRQP